MNRTVASVFFTLMVFSINASAALIDFGERGNTQEIAEPSLKKHFATAMKDFNATKRQDEFRSSIQATGDAVLNLPGCDKNSTRAFIPLRTLSKDYFSPDGKVVAKKGTQFNPLSKFIGIKQPKIVIFDGTSEEQVRYVRDLCPEGACILALNRGNSVIIEKEMGLKTYPLPKPFMETLKAKCSMSIFDAVGDSYQVAEIRLEKTKNEK